MVALEIALARPRAVRHVAPIAAPAATGPMAVAWNHLQVQLIEHLGLDGMSLARQLAMTTYGSEADFEERLGARRGRRAAIDRQLPRPSGPQARGSRFDAATYRVPAGAMDRHDIGAGRGGEDRALAELGSASVRLTGIGIQDDILYGPRQVRALVDAAERAGVEARYREVRSTRGHDAFLVEWDQLTSFLQEALRPGVVATIVE